MLCCAVLCCAVLCCAALRCAVLCCAVLCVASCRVALCVLVKVRENRYVVLSKDFDTAYKKHTKKNDKEFAFYS